MSFSAAVHEDSNIPVTNTLFPPPPDCFKSFTPLHLQRYAELLGQSSETNKGKGREYSTQGEQQEETTQRVPRHLSDEEQTELDALRSSLNKPRADWVRDEGRWMCFGQMYNVRPTHCRPGILLTIRS
jgi:mediator of RNA polymerase II transcription subunit 7